MARQLADLGARVAICARDADELDRAYADLAEHGEVFSAVCDVTEQGQVESLVDRVRDRFGPVDVLINNAGLIQVGPLLYQTQKDFEDAMKIHFWAPYFAIQAVLREMRKRRAGRIVNICSIGGKIAVPHLAPYCASKFALAGLSSGLRAELVKGNIYVTTAYPGLMRTGSHINAFFKGRHRAEFALFSLINGLPISSISAESAAHQVLAAAQRGDPEVVVSIQAKIATKINGLFPSFTAEVLGLTDRLLPEEGGLGAGCATGLDSTSVAAPSFLTAFVDSASSRNNELKPNESIN
jgi:short-subunit dehydrogenase